MTQPVARPAIAAAPLGDARARLTKAAEDFTAVTLGEMLKPMFNTVDNSNDLFGGKQGEAAWKPMMIDEIAKAMAHKGGLGLAEPVARAMIALQEKKSS
jgi:Rod binding domain-containing protein